MPKKKFIVLPNIKSFEILDYPMFNEDWKCYVKAGLNLVLGVNEIGKTTTANLMIYARVGTHKGIHEEHNPEYFMDRLDNRDDFLNDKAKRPRIKLDIVVGTTALFVTRSLAADAVLNMGNAKHEIAGYDELTEHYEEKIKELTGLTTLEDLAFLLSNLLVREEEGNYLLWSEDSQSRVIRLLLNTMGFAEEYKDLEKDLQTLEYIEHLISKMSYNVHMGFLCVFDARDVKSPIGYQSFGFVPSELAGYETFLEIGRDCPRPKLN